MKRSAIALIVLLLPLCTVVQAQDSVTLHTLARDYADAVSAMNLPRFQLGYLDNLNGILSEASRTEQQSRFAAIRNDLETLGFAALPQEEQYLYLHLEYVLDLQLRRIDLENRFKRVSPGSVTATTGIFRQPMGKEWYQYFLDKWLSVKMTPEELIVFGESEVLKVQNQIEGVRNATGYAADEAGFYEYLDSDEFILTNDQDVIAAYQGREAVVQQHLGELFRSVNVPEVRIAPFDTSDKDTVPGQLMVEPEFVFRFNFFEQRHNTQDMDFLYLHEVLPGHAFHLQYNQDYPQAEYQLTSLGAYAGHLEGWGAYVEELGEDAGLYQTPWLKMGKLKFDLVRSARIALDVGINYLGWDNQQALDYWFAHIKGQDAIAQREIDRVRRWPGQALSYKVGAHKLLELRAAAEKAFGEDFDIREFHHQVLAFGAVPLFLVERRVLDYIRAG